MRFQEKAVLIRLATRALTMLYRCAAGDRPLQIRKGIVGNRWRVTKYVNAALARASEVAYNRDWQLPGLTSGVQSSTVTAIPI
jgi:hypothetical protein